MMTTEQAVAILTYANQIDPFVQINDINAEVWWEALKNRTYDQAMWCIKDYYANTKPGWNGKVEPITPAALRARIVEKSQQADAKRRALEPPQSSVPHPNNFRSRKPGEYDRLFKQAGLKHIADLKARGIPLHEWQLNRTGTSEEVSTTTRGVAPF